MLIGNYSILNKTPGRDFSGVAHSTTRASTNKPSSMRGFYVDIERQLAAVPNGTTPPVSWVIPRVSGGIASRTGAQGRGAVSDLNLAGGLNAEAGLTGSGNITLAGILYAIVANAALTGSGTTSSSLGGTIPAAADLTGSADILATIAAAVAMSADLAGSSTVNADIAGALQAIADLIGSGSVTAGITGSLNAISDLSGSGNITEAQANAIWNMVADILVAADLDGSMTGKGNIIANPEGDGTIEANPSAKAFMAASVVVTGDMLTAQSVAEAIKPDLEVINEGVRKASLSIPHSTDLT